MVEEHWVPRTIAALPWIVKGPAVVASLLLSAFANKLPEALQNLGYYVGLALAAWVIFASIWHWADTWLVNHGQPRLKVGTVLIVLGLVIVAAGVGYTWRGSAYSNADISQKETQNIFDVEYVVPGSMAVPDSEWIQITARLRFKAAFQDGEIALFGYPNINVKTAQPSFLVYRLPRQNFLVGETSDIPIATVFIAETNRRPTNDFWGNSETVSNGLPKHEFVGATENIAEIQLTNSGKVVQSFKVFFATFVPGTGGRGRVFILPENRNVFKAE
jgi:hypothetical protein